MSPAWGRGDSAGWRILDCEGRPLRVEARRPGSRFQVALGKAPRPPWGRLAATGAAFALGALCGGLGAAWLVLRAVTAS